MVRVTNPKGGIIERRDVLGYGSGVLYVNADIEGASELRVGTAVTFRPTMTDRGRHMAKEVKIA